MILLRFAGGSDPIVGLVLAVLLATVLVAATVEGIVLSLASSRDYDWRAYAASLADLAGRRAVDALGLSLGAPVVAFAARHALAPVPLHGFTAFAVLFLGQELLYYGFHRAAHRIHWFWATHAVHHSPNQLTLASALRLGWTGKASGTGLFFAPLVWLGFPVGAVAGMVAVNLLYQFWLHATWIPRLGPLEAVFNTPSHHRVHHGANAEYLDCNYGGVLIVFDRLFGTFVAERDDIAIRYGLATPLESHDPLRIELHGWRGLGRAVLGARGVRGGARALLGPPPP